MKKLCSLIILIMLSLGSYAQSEEEQLAAQYYQKKEYEKAVEIYKELYRDQPTVFYYKYYLDCLIKLEDFSEAKRLVRKQKRDSDFPLKYAVELGYLYLQEDEEKKARRHFKDAIKEIEPNRQDYIDLANAFVSRDLYDYAIQVLEKGNRRINSDRAFHMELAGVYARTRRYNKMMEQYLQLLDKAPDYSRVIKDELQLFIEDGEAEKIRAIKNILLERTQSQSSNSLYAELLMWFSIQLKDFKIALLQAKALDRRFNEDGQRVFYLAKILKDNRKYDLAAEAYQYVMKKGEDKYLYLGSLIRLLDVKFEKLTQTTDFDKEELDDLEQEYHNALSRLGTNASTVELMLNMAHMQAFYMGKSDEARKLLEEAIKIPGAKPRQIAECKIELADILTMAGDVWEATLLYQQVDKAFKEEPLGHLAKFKNAKLSFYIGEFQWALTQLDVLKAATSKLIANDAMQLALLIRDNIGLDSSVAAIETYARADLYAFQKKTALALKTLDTLEQFYVEHNIMDEVLFRKAEIHIDQRNYKTADSLLNMVVEQYSYDILADDALMTRAELNEFYLQRPERARSLYKKLITEYPGSLYTVKARKRFRMLRGDKVLPSVERMNNISN